MDDFEIVVKLNWIQLSLIIIFCLLVLLLLYKISLAIEEQTEWLKEDEEIENIGNN